MTSPPIASQTASDPTWSIGDEVVFKPMYGRAVHRHPSVYVIRGVDGAAVWLRRPGGGGHITVGANWIVPAPEESTT